jgi:hypothetical protein
LGQHPASFDRVDIPMGQWVKCTLYPNKKVVHVNLDQIAQLEWEGGSTKVYTVLGQTYSVVETPEILLGIDAP